MPATTKKYRRRRGGSKKSYKKSRRHSKKSSRRHRRGGKGPDDPYSAWKTQLGLDKSTANPTNTEPTISHHIRKDTNTNLSGTSTQLADWRKKQSEYDTLSGRVKSTEQETNPSSSENAINPVDEHYSETNNAGPWMKANTTLKGSKYKIYVPHD